MSLSGYAGGQHRLPTTRYQQIDLASRIDGATPHALVALLYAELSAALAVMVRATETGDAARRIQQHERASAMLHALESGLDRVGGGTLATSLAVIYRQMRQRLVAGRSGDAAATIEVAAGVESLATAWATLSV